MKLYSVLVAWALVGVCRSANCTTLAEVKSLPPFAAEVMGFQIHEDATHDASLEIRLRKKDGSNFVITEPKTSLFQIAFATSLRRGQTYSWPQVFLDFERMTLSRPDPPRWLAK